MTAANPVREPCIGIVANPVSARDIRRIVANAGNLQITDRVNIVLRVLTSAAACGVKRALVMPDRGGIRALLERHLRRGHDHGLPEIEFLDMEPTSTVDDTFTATRLMQQAGVAAIVVLGGDGTHRAVVRELVEGGAPIPIAGLSTGTNNAFPEMREPTIVGMAVGLYASGRIAAAEALAPNKLIEVYIADSHGPGRRDVAIVDAVITHDRSIGARALWKTQSLDAAYLAFADPQAIGLSAIGGLLQPVGRRDSGGLAVQLARDEAHALLLLHAPIAPGMVRPVPIRSWQRMVADEPLAVSASAGTVALDGERELAFEPGQAVSMTLRENAFHTLDVACCMAVAARDGLLRFPTTTTTTL
ncbi:Acetoin catabolism protein X [Rubrivivax sp. A210]|uniref:ATP-NAD kinase family protein n=1 Tax=Rubrivivax sp. A210 TaxID=2772301 RepID=UPI001919F86B|nr:NAD(+)/NADH kinase [Rubrivivax sp. A210]CAD5366308.1 Acetoin catabolism protein X [Rubrivivax sp. A210]